MCDHNDDAAVERAVAAIFADEGRLDLLVNNAFGGQDNGNVATKAIGEPFWRKPLWLWDAAHRVGLRSHYVATVLCARQWEDRGQKGAVVANVSSPGGLDYLFDVAYGVGKAANDRLASDMSVELSGMGVTVCSIWPGAVRTELVAQSAREQAAARAKPKHTAVTAATAGKGVLSKDNMQGVRFGEMESVEFTGRGIAAMLADPQARERWGGRVVLTPELAEWYGFTDTNGKVPWGMLRNMRGGALSRPPPHWRPVAARL